jgi:hypothetical protein
MLDSLFGDADQGPFHASNFQLAQQLFFHSLHTMFASDPGFGSNPSDNAAA